MNRFERENGSLRNYASGLSVLAEPAVGGDERVDIKEIENDGLRNGKIRQKCKMVMLRNGFFGNL